MALHAPQVHGFFSMPLDHLTAIGELADHYRDSDLSNAVVACTCTCGALGALWHVVSALLALMALPRANGPSKRCRSGARALAVRVLEAWGAPAVRRIVASALLVSLSSAPALAAEGTAGGDDLGWHPTSSAPASWATLAM